MGKRTELLAIINGDHSNAKSLFVAIARVGYNWSDILEVFVLKKGKNDKITQENNEAMRTLIEARDTYDFSLYESAAHQLFGNLKFTVKVNPEGVVKDDASKFTLKYYTIKVFKGSNKGYEFTDDSRPHLTIQVMAPGSRTLTSDIDTTISVSEAQSLAGELASHFGQDVQTDFDMYVKVEIISAFYSLSENDCGITSSESRDSNVYSDGFVRKEEGKGSYPDYPKFNLLQRNIEEIGDDQIIVDYYKFYNKYKRVKQQYELAASLIPLVRSLSVEEWVDFKSQVKTRIEAEFDPSEFGLPDLASIHKNLEEVFAYVGNWVRKLNEELEECIRNKKEGDHASESPFKEFDKKEAFERDICVSAMNELYVKNLREIIKVNLNLKIIKNDIANLCVKMKSLYKHKCEGREYLKSLEDNYSPQNKHAKREFEAIKEQKNKLAAIEENYKNQVEELQKMLRKQARLINEKQKLQIEANLFANEAYTNRSAPLHVLEGMQQGIRTSISKQVVMGSVLQQIGVKLLHMKELSQRAASSGEAGYKTAKYGQRVADMVFGQSDHAYTPPKLIGDIHSGDIPIFERLRRVQTNMSALFTGNEYRLLNSELAIVEGVKRNEVIADHAKFAKSEELMVAPDKQKKRFLSIAQKTLTIAYKARLKDKGALWGEFIPPKRLGEGYALYIMSSLSGQKMPKENAVILVNNKEGNTYKVYLMQDGNFKENFGIIHLTELPAGINRKGLVEKNDENCKVVDQILKKALSNSSFTHLKPLNLEEELKEGAEHRKKKGDKRKHDQSLAKAAERGAPKQKLGSPSQNGGEGAHFALENAEFDDIEADNSNETGTSSHMIISGVNASGNGKFKNTNKRPPQ